MKDPAKILKLASPTLGCVDHILYPWVASKIPYGFPPLPLVEITGAKFEGDKKEILQLFPPV